MNIQLECVDSTYSLSGNIATVTLTFRLVDTDLTDENGNPKVLDVKTISVSQNVLDPNAKDNLKAKILTQVEKYLTSAKTNVSVIYNLFGTTDPEQILENLKNELQTDIQALVQNTFGGN